MFRPDDLTTSGPASRAGGDDHDTGALPAAMLWDMDGTLVATEPHWFAAERDLLDRFGHGDWRDRELP